MGAPSKLAMYNVSGMQAGPLKGSESYTDTSYRILKDVTLNPEPLTLNLKPEPLNPDCGAANLNSEASEALSNPRGVGGVLYQGEGMNEPAACS